METGMIIAIVIAAIIQIVAIIVFFVMAKNVSVIRRQKTISHDEYFRMAQEEIYIGNKEKAKEYLMRAKYFILTNDPYGVEQELKIIEQKLSEL